MTVEVDCFFSRLIRQFNAQTSQTTIFLIGKIHEMYVDY